MAAEANSQTPEPPDTVLAAEQRRAKEQWYALGQRALTITPSALLRSGLVIVGFFAVLWVVRASWPAPLPFMVGGVVAYLVLPIVNRLDRVMPRRLAALLTVALVFLVIAGTLVLVLRVVALEAVKAYEAFPETSDINEYIDDMDQYISTLPDPIENTVRAQIEDSAVAARQRIEDGLFSFDHPVRTVLLGIVNAVAIVFGLLVLPIWILLVLRDQRAAKEAINRVLPDWMEGDFWGIVRLVDRTLGAFLRGMVLTGLAVGATLTAGLLLLDYVGFEGIRYPLALGLLAVFLELIPLVGPAILTIVVVAIPAAESLETSAAVLGLMVLIRLLVRNQIARHVERKVIDVHPAILLVILVILSQFGLIWTLLAAPVAAVGLDLFRYVFGRCSDPPRPAGLLPGEPLPAVARDSAVVARTPRARRVPLVYQRSRPRGQ